jgi:MFS family permease
MNWRYWLFVAGRAVSTLGDGFGTIAMGWLVYDLTGSKLAMGSLYLVGMVPEVLLRLFGAPIIDRVNRTRLMASLDTLQFVTYLTPLLLSWTGHLQLWHLYALYVVAGIAHSLYRPAVLTVVPSLVGPERLIRAVSVLDGTLQAALVTGPVIAGFVVTYVSGAAALALNALTFAVSALALVLITGRVQPGGLAKAAAKQPYWEQLTEGFGFFRQMPALFLLTLMLGICNISAWAIFSMHAPYVKERLMAGPEIVGAMQAAWPLGFLVGTAMIATIGEVRRRRTLMLGALIGAGVALGGLGLVPAGMVPAALALKVMEGFSFSLFSNTSTVLFQRLVPDRLLGRVMSVRLLLAWGGNPVGAFLGGFLGERMGLGPTFVLAGGLSVLVGLVGFGVASLKAVDGEMRVAEGRQHAVQSQG